jgi:thioredoxin-dependent peroxiredoxin
MIAAGTVAPEFIGATQQGTTLSLKGLRGRSVVLYFYPKADTPGCTIESKGFRDAYADFQRGGVDIVGVSVDTVADQRAFADKCALPFPLVADADRAVATRYGVLGPRGTARRITFLIDPAGQVTQVIESSDALEHVRAARAALLRPDGR